MSPRVTSISNRQKGVQSRRHVQRARVLFWFFLLTMVVTSCREGTYFHHSEILPVKGWDMNHLLYFCDSLPVSTPPTVQMELTLRHNNKYPYQNLWLYIHTLTSDSIARTDSINWILAGPNGKLLGTGWGSFYNITLRLPDLTFSDADTTRWFKMEIRHGLRDSLLDGLEDIGLRLYTDK